MCSHASTAILFVVLSSAIMAARSLAIQFETGRALLDLSYDYDEETIVWPQYKNFELTDIYNATDNLGVWKSAMSFFTPEHSGTHLDAPYHFYIDGWTVEQIPIENFFAPLVNVDISDRVNAGDVDAQLTVEDLHYWEEQHGRIPDGSVVFMHSGWGKHWPNVTAYYGDDVSNKTTPFTDLHFPGIHLEAAQWLMTNRSIVGMGTDTASLDSGQQSAHFRTHKVLSAYNVYGLENVKGLDKVPPSGATAYVFPMKIRGGTGAPCRVIAAV